MKPVRLLVVDDQASMRRLIISHLHRDPGIDVIGEAANPAEARAAIKALDPDVITLDVEMPGMDGLDFLERIMRLRPMPVVMVSSLTTRGADKTLRALELGAVDCIAKPSAGDPNSLSMLPQKVHAAARASFRGRAAPSAAKPEVLAREAAGPSLIAIGASTGGVEAILDVLSRFPADCPPTVIVQHMPQFFTKSFAERLDRVCACSVREATDSQPLQTGVALLAPGGEAHLEVSGREQLYCRLRRAEPVSGHRPSVDVLFRSVAKSIGPKSVGVILTGMGRDGAEGLLEMRRAGAHTIAQDSASCIVYGMPKIAVEIGAAQKKVPLRRIAAEILSTKPLP
jgi:two-component system chemotaxis response regulator CheB